MDPTLTLSPFTTTLFGLLCSPCPSVRTAIMANPTRAALAVTWLVFAPLVSQLLLAGAQVQQVSPGAIEYTGLFLLPFVTCCFWDVSALLDSTATWHVA